jgi:hypothetical protein
MGRGCTDAAPGGTAAVVGMRWEGEHHAEGFKESPLFEGSGSRLDLAPGGPVLQVVAPRRKNDGAVRVTGQTAPQPGDCFLLPGCDDPHGTLPKRVEPSAFLSHRLGSLILGRRGRHDAGYPREEPGAGKPHARIREGESRMAELLDHNLPGQIPPFYQIPNGNQRRNCRI